MISSPVSCSASARNCSSHRSWSSSVAPDAACQRYFPRSAQPCGVCARPRQWAGIRLLTYPHRTAFVQHLFYRLGMHIPDHDFSWSHKQNSNDDDATRPRTHTPGVPPRHIDTPHLDTPHFDTRTSAPGAPPRHRAVTSPTTGDVYYGNCSGGRAAGAAPVYVGQPGYRPALDRDGDGVGCES